MTDKLVRWLIFGVIASLLPFVLICLNLWTSKKSVKIENLFSRGELLLVSTAIGTAAIGELIGTDNKNALLKIVVGGTSIIAILIQAAWYAHANDAEKGLDARSVAVASLIFFAITIVCSFACLCLVGG